MFVLNVASMFLYISVIKIHDLMSKMKMTWIKKGEINYNCLSEKLVVHEKLFPNSWKGSE